MENNEVLNVIDVDIVPYEGNINDEEGTKIPIEKFANFGVGAAIAETLFKTIQHNKIIDGGLYKVDFPKGTHLSAFKDGRGFFGMVRDNKTNKPVKQAVINPSSIQKVPVDPMAIAMMAMLANMEKKLADIQELQKEMMQFLEQKEKSEQRGNLIFLQDIYENYKFNTDNEKYIQNNHVKVLDIKQTAEQKIDFYKSQIKAKLEKGEVIHLDSDVSSQEKKLKNDLGEYQLALYTYAFSSLMDIVFLENFEEDFLERIKEKIKAYKFEYQSIYTEVFNYIEKRSDSSLQQLGLDVASKATKGLGGLFKDTFIGDKTGIDETLTKTGEDIGNYKNKRTDEKTFKLIENKESKVEPFIDNIEKINTVYNKPVIIMFDKDNLIVKPEKAS